jgi:hypothetical protein
MRDDTDRQSCCGHYLCLLPPMNPLATGAFKISLMRVFALCEFSLSRRSARVKKHSCGIKVVIGKGDEGRSPACWCSILLFRGMQVRRPFATLRSDALADYNNIFACSEARYFGYTQKHGGMRSIYTSRRTCKVDLKNVWRV